MPVITKEKLGQKIKAGEIAGAYLLYGEEQFLVSRYGRNLRKLAVSSYEDINATRFIGKFQDTARTLKEISDVSQTMPFFSEKRVIEISGSGFFKTRGSKKATEEDEEEEEDIPTGGIGGAVSSLIASLPDTCVIIFEETEIDKRSSLYKQINKTGTVVEFPLLKPAELKEAVRREAKRMGLEIEAPALSELTSCTGDSLWMAVKELEKLKGYCSEKGAATVSDVREVCIRNPEDRVFDMVEAMSSGRKRDAMKIYRDMLALGKNTFLILSLVTRDYNLLLSARDGLDRGLSDREISPLLKCSPNVAWRYIKRAGSMTRASLIQGLERCARTQQDIKTGLLPERIALELFIAESG